MISKKVTRLSASIIFIGLTGCTLNPTKTTPLTERAEAVSHDTALQMFIFEDKTLTTAKTREGYMVEFSPHASAHPQQDTPVLIFKD